MTEINIKKKWFSSLELTFKSEFYSLPATILCKNTEPVIVVVISRARERNEARIWFNDLHVILPKQFPSTFETPDGGLSLDSSESLKRELARDVVRLCLAAFRSDCVCS